MKKYLHSYKNLEKTLLVLWQISSVFIKIQNKAGIFEEVVEIKPQTVGIVLYRANAGSRDQTALYFY